MRIIQDKGRKSNARFQRIWPCKPKTCRAIRGNCGPPFSAAGSGGRGECGRRDLIRLAVPGKCRARRRSLAFFDRCGNCVFAVSAPGGAKPQFHLAAVAVCAPRRKASARKAARLRKLRLCCIRPRRRKAAIPPAPHSLPLPFESPSGMQKGMTARRTVIPFCLSTPKSTLFKLSTPKSTPAYFL